MGNNPSYFPGLGPFRPVVLNQTDNMTGNGEPDKVLVINSPGLIENTKAPLIHDAFLLVANLERVMRRLQSEFLSEDGKRVNYSGMRTSRTFQEYQELSRELVGIDLYALDETARKTFFINLYNLLTIHALVNHTKEKVPVKSMTELGNFWTSVAYRIGPNGWVFTLDDIEHGILRGNKAHPSRSFLSKKHFSATDPRSAISCTTCDPRIHFALSCGASSCPRITVLESNDAFALDRSLDTAARVFCNDEENVQLDAEKGEIRLSKIFQWYAGDFGGNRGEVLGKISSWLSDERKVIIENLILQKANLRYMPYNWHVNAAE